MLTSKSLSVVIGGQVVSVDLLKDDWAPLKNLIAKINATSKTKYFSAELIVAEKQYQPFKSYRNNGKRHHKQIARVDGGETEPQTHFSPFKFYRRNRP